jgi:hypothetical protein
MSRSWGNAARSTHVSGGNAASSKHQHSLLVVLHKHFIKRKISKNVFEIFLLASVYEAKPEKER